LCLAQLNEQLHAVLPPELYATMFYAVINTDENTMTYATAAAPPPVLLHGWNRQPEENETGYTLLEGFGLPLAAKSDAPAYQCYTTPFLPGDSLILYSDALIETPNEANQFLEIERFCEALETLPEHDRRASTILSAIQDTLQHFTDATPEDDLTINVYTRNDTF
ncbi:MAG: PP2C family protein-serine/threonine phosphatase, partial [Rickettsiales bacterium]